MGPAEESHCCHQMLVRAESDNPEPSNICSCPAGLIHMHDCPVLLGLACLHFVSVEGAEPAMLAAKDHEQVHDELMEDFLSRPYAHRVRSLAPEGDAWGRRCAELAERYADYEPEPDDAPDEVSEEFEAERARLLKIRQRKDDQRREREEEELKRREARRKEQAERLVREAERRAAARAERKAKEQLRRAEKGEAAPGEEPKRRRRRRRRAKPSPAAGPGGTGAPSAPSAPKAPGAPSKPAAGSRPASEGSDGAASRPRRRRRRRRRRGPGPGGDSSA